MQRKMILMGMLVLVFNYQQSMYAGGKHKKGIKSQQNGSNQELSQKLQARVCDYYTAISAMRFDRQAFEDERCFFHDFYSKKQAWTYEKNLRVCDAAQEVFENRLQLSDACLQRLGAMLVASFKEECRAHYKCAHPLDCKGAGAYEIELQHIQNYKTSQQFEADKAYITEIEKSVK